MTVAAGATALRPRRRPGATGVSSSFGTFGELMQGVLPGADGDVLVTLPVAQWSVATFSVDVDDATITSEPSGKSKSRHMARLVLDALNVPYGGLLHLGGTLPEGKGMASSSADLVATARAVANALGRDIGAELIAALLRRIEPTDGVMYPGIVAFDHRRVQLRSRLGSLPSLTIIGVDEGGIIDTVAFNQLRKPFSAADRRRYEQLLGSMARAVAAGDLVRVGALATRSAQMNQQLCPKRTLDAVRDICIDIGGLGVVAAHSGTMLGVLLDPDAPDYRRRLSDGLRACAGVGESVSLYRTLAFA